MTEYLQKWSNKWKNQESDAIVKAGSPWDGLKNVLLLKNIIYFTSIFMWKVFQQQFTAESRPLWSMLPLIVCGSSVIVCDCRLWFVCIHLWLICSPLWLVCSRLWLICSHLWLICNRLWLICSLMWLVFSCNNDQIGINSIQR